MSKDMGKAAPSAGTTDRGKNNRHGSAYGAKSKPAKYSKVVDAKEAGPSAVKRARANHHGDNATKVMPFVPSGAAAPPIPNKRHGHFAIDHVHGDGLKRISRLDD